MQHSSLHSSLAEALEPSLSPLAAAAAPARPLRIAIVSEYYYPHLGGICEHVYYFARQARRAGHHVDIITSNIRGAAPEDNVIRLGYSQAVFANGSLARVSVGFGLRQQMREILRNGRYDIVHAHSPLMPVLPLLAIDEADCPVVGTFHTHFDRSLAYEVGRQYFTTRLRRLDAAIAVSPSAVEAFSQYFDADWKVIPNGIDIEEFQPGARRPADMRSDVPVILYLGRLDPRNGLRDLIEAFHLLRAADYEAQLVIVGDGPLRSYYRRFANGSPDITFVGSVLGSRAEYYANSTIYACPTTRGASFGITLLEAAACETPIVCTRIAGFRDVVKHRREALMVPRRDPHSFADALTNLLDDETLRARMGKAGRETAIRYSWKTVTDSVLALYASLLGHARAA